MPRKFVGGAGFVIMLMGISGAIDHLWVQPLMGQLLNVINRQVIPRIEVLEGYELYVNLGVAAVGFTIMALSDRLPEE